MTPPVQPEQPNSHLANKSILVHRSSLLSGTISRRLSPHLLHILQDHIAMSVESLDTREQFSIVSAGYQDLGVRADSRLEDGERTGCEFMLFELSNLELAIRRVSMG